MATYKQVQDLVRDRHNFLAKSCWIARVLSDSGREMKKTPNRVTSSSRKHICPPNKRKLIAEALSDFGMISASSNLIVLAE